jgi:NADPH-dependent F420 reductase
VQIAIIGVGNVGSALGARLAESGFHVTFGARSLDKAPQIAGTAAALPAEAAARADVVFLAVPARVAVEAARSLGSLEGKILVDCNNPLRFEGAPIWAPPPEGSLAAALQAALPKARVVKAFNGFGAEFHRNPTIDAEHAADVLVAGDDAEAKAAVSSIAKQAGFSPIDAGPLRNAALLENVAILWIHLALVGGHGRDVAFKLLSRTQD